jgi:drug/metabolite transporter (DMT)-like permease
MENEQSSGNRLALAMIASMVMWGISWPSNKILVQAAKSTDALVSSNDLGIYRYTFVVLSLLPLLLFLKVPLKIAKKGIPFLLISGILMAAYNFTFLQGLTYGSPGKGGILVTTLNPIMAYALGMAVDWRRPNRNESIGLALGVTAGLILLKIWDGGASLLDTDNLFFLLAAFLWSVMSKFTSRSSNFGSPFAFSWWMYVVTLIAILPFMNGAIVLELTHSREPRFWGNLIFSSVIVTTLATTMYFFATAKIGAEKASSFIFTVPVSAALAAYFILGEQIEAHTIAGGALGIGAVYMINRKTNSNSVTS